jgi:hypothetical protein
MKKSINLLIWTAMFSVTCLNCHSQYKKNTVVLDLAGKSLYYFDISYERYLTEKLHFGAGAGLGNIYTGYKHPDEKHRDFELRFPVYGAYALGKKRHHAITELGVMIEDDFSTDWKSLLRFWPFISIGYEFKGSNIIIRIPVYLGYVGPNLWWPAILPWAGLSIGVPF